ncbi:hypothetical protein A3K93_04385 [Acinetobacter sp. NCu2D-2]|uniref:MCR_0457 family protein n=1 Tax=Acinetobacter sp. NCu2D-2 TaxID=1608473 RepID=UPI0007CE0876|nr:hypothetical protein [Acinetobacter sp. NCu2D-2]ANF81501.1 hypothetical protein A3K93_04385 [Acinetobacter sp. NCu2D-2]
MKKPLFNALSILALSMSGLLAQNAFAANDNIDVTPDQQVTQQELAAIYVISEVCPSLVSDQAKFEKGFNKLAKEYLPSQKNPVQALNQLMKQSTLSPVLVEARNDAKVAGQAKNQAICNELSNY